ncbi:MAG TPA: oligosaccharide flippase family protein [Candidatus Dormibacteraeota bacterium]|nr:oligosaccharide flippase family protein [Candidatus Dormibacteraeota bacterium]
MKALATRPRTVEVGTSSRTLAMVIRSATGAAMVGYLVDLVVIPLVVRRVGAATYGVWAVGASILTIAALADVGIRAEVVRRVAAAVADGDDAAVRRSVQLGTSILAMLVVPVAIGGWFAVPAIRGVLLPLGAPGESAAQLDLFLRAVILAAAVTVVLNGYFGVLRGLQRNDIETRSTLIGSLVGAAATVGGALAGAGLWSLAGGWAAQTVVQLLLEWRGTRAVAPDLRFRLLRISPTTLRPFLALSGLVLLSQVSDVIDTQWDKLVLAHYVGPAVVASFQLGTMLVLQAKALAVLPLTPLLTAVAELGRSRSDEARRIYSELERCSFALGGAILSAAFAFGPAFVRLWLGADFAAAGTVVRLLVVAVALNLYAAPLALRAFGEEAHRLPAIGSVVNVVVNGALSLVLTRSIGLNGALYGSIAGNLAGTALFLVLMRRAHGKGWRLPSLRAFSVATCLAVALMLAHAGDVASWPLLVAVSALYLAAVTPICLRLERTSLRSILRGAPA